MHNIFFIFWLYISVKFLTREAASGHYSGSLIVCISTLMVNHVKELQKLNHLHFLKVYVLQMNLFIPLCIYFYWALNLLKVILCFSCSSISHSWLVWSQIPLWWAFSVFFILKQRFLNFWLQQSPFLISSIFVNAHDLKLKLLTSFIYPGCLRIFSVSEW